MFYQFTDLIVIAVDLVDHFTNRLLTVCVPMKSTNLARTQRQTLDLNEVTDVNFIFKLILL